MPMMVRVDGGYYPGLGLSMFLGWAGLGLDSVKILPGKELRIPATGQSRLEKDLSIPIDKQGNIFVPFVNKMGKDFDLLTVHKFLEYYEDENLRGNLAEFFEGNFVIIADVSTGISDLGYTPLEPNTPLVTLHATVLNSLLTRTFYTWWPRFDLALLFGIIVLLLIGSACLNSPWIFYGTGGGILAAITALTWFEFTRFTLFPLATMGGAVLIFFLVANMITELLTSRDRAFIRHTFSRYMPDKIIHELLNDPDLIKLGGEEREITVLFSDIVGFTSISEALSPKQLILLLNEYFTHMTEIIQAHDGIIDKFIGDAIMAEFGVPIPEKNPSGQRGSVQP